jgi:transcriptional regulator with XRE-family HTH domain
MSPGRQHKLAERLRLLREQRGLSLGDLEEKTGVTKGYLSELERAEATNPSIDILKKIAGGLDVLVQELLGDTADTAEAAAARGKLPPGLNAFVKDARERGVTITDDDVAMLQGINYRGRYPRTADDYALIYDMVRRIVK